MGRFKNFDEFDVGEDKLKSHLVSSGGYLGDPDALYCRASLYQDVYINGESLIEHSKFMSCCTYAIIYRKERHSIKNDLVKLSDYLDNPDINEYYRVYLSEVEKAELYKNEIRKYYEYLKCEADSYDEETFKDQNRIMYIIRYSPSEMPENSKKNIMLDLLKEYLPVIRNDGLIPFDMEERRELYSKAFDDLAEYKYIANEDIYEF